GPDIVQQQRLTLLIGMQSVGLHQAGHQRDVLEQERQQRDVVLVRQSLIHGHEAAGIALAVVGRQSQAQQQYRDVLAAQQRDHLLEVVAGLVERQAAQAVVGAQFEQ